MRRVSIFYEMPTPTIYPKAIATISKLPTSLRFGVAGALSGRGFSILRQRLSLRTQPYQITLGMCRIPAKVAGQLWRLLKKQCRLMYSQRHYFRVSAHPSGTRMLKSCYLLFDKNFIAILN